MTKNGMIRVFDEFGNEIGQTYPKRVNGLIKKGRARFLDESGTAIVLTETEPKNMNTEACPPNNLTLSEDINMATNTAIVLENNTEGIREETGAMPEELRRLYDKLDEIDKEIFKFGGAPGQVTTDEFIAMLEQLDEMREDTVHMIEDFKKTPEPSKNNTSVEKIYAAQLDSLASLMQEQERRTAEYLIEGEIDVDEYEKVTAALDARFSKRMNELISNIANAGKEKAENADNANE